MSLPKLNKNMTNIIHYEEDIFFLKAMINTLKKGYSLNIDSFIFLEYSVNQLLFISKAIKKINSSVSETSHKNSPEQIRNIIRLVSIFRDILDDLINKRLKNLDCNRNYIANLKTIDQEHRRDTARLKEILIKLSEEEDTEDLVSEEETLFLLQDN